jgi:hypothetical protein
METLTPTLLAALVEDLADIETARAARLETRALEYFEEGDTENDG